MTDQSPDRTATGRSLSPERVREGLLAALAPATACVLALGGLTTWTVSGAAGSPPRIAISDSRVFLPYGDNTDTAAFFSITNSGDSGDQLTAVTSPAVAKAMLSRHVSTGKGADSMRMSGSVEVSAGGTLVMSPSSLDVMVQQKAGHRRWKEGDVIPFVLHFRHSGAVHTVAAVVRPGS